MRTDSMLLKIDYTLNKNNGSTKGFIASDMDVKCNIQCHSTKYLIAGGVYNKNKGLLIYNVKDIDEARQITSNNKLLTNSSYTCQLVSHNYLNI